MHRYMVQRQTEFAAAMATRLQQTLNDLERLQRLQLTALNAGVSQLELNFQRARVEKRTKEIHGVFDDYRNWVEETMTTEPQPFIQLLAAVCR